MSAFSWASPRAEGLHTIWIILPRVVGPSRSRVANKISHDAPTGALFFVLFVPSPARTGGTTAFTSAASPRYGRARVCMEPMGNKIKLPVGGHQAMRNSSSSTPIEPHITDSPQLPPHEPQVNPPTGDFQVFALVRSRPKTCRTHHHRRRRLRQRRRRR
jgi:hypothetical protein